MCRRFFFPTCLNSPAPRRKAAKVHYAFAQSDATRIPLADKSVDLVFTSPPYLAARTYGIGAQRGVEEWVDWMLEVVRECLRVCKGAVMVNCAGQTKQRNYQPVPEGLLYRAWQSGIHAYRPCYWHRVGIPGSGGDQWYRADVEYVFCFKAEGKLPFANPTANGHAPKWVPGGEMSHRLSNGMRVNQWGGTMKRSGHINTERLTSGALREIRYKPSHRFVDINNRLERGNEKGKTLVVPAKANPGNLFRCVVGGGKMGHALAHDTDAPFPLKLAEYFIRSHCPKGGIVLDPFSGSGTTVHAAYNLGRIGLGFDLRMSQCELGTRRMKDVTEKHGLFMEVA